MPPRLSRLEEELGYPEFGADPAAFDDFANLSDEELDIDPLKLDTATEPELPRSGYRRILESLGGFENQNFGQPQSFGEGLVSGFTQGVGRAGTRAATETQKFEAAGLRRQAERDKFNREATEKYKDRRATAISEKRKGSVAARKEQMQFDRDNPIVTPELRAQYPALEQFPEGQRVTKEVFQEVQKRSLPEKPETPAEKRARAAGERAASAADRQALAAEVANVSKLSDQAEADPDIKGFPTIRDSYETGLDGSKRNNSAGDIILMRMIAKTTDPTTGVREEEFRTFQGAQGELAKYGVRLTREMWGKGTLSDFGRSELTSVLQGIYDRKLGNYRKAYDYHANRAKGLGLDQTRIVRDYAPTGWFQSNAPRAGR